MQPTPELIDQLYREEVLRARQMTPEEKLRAGPALFDYACKIMVSGIQAQHPHADERELRDLIQARLRLIRKLEAVSSIGIEDTGDA